MYMREVFQQLALFLAPLEESTFLSAVREDFKLDDSFIDFWVNGWRSLSIEKIPLVLDLDMDDTAHNIRLHSTIKVDEETNILRCL